MRPPQAECLPHYRLGRRGVAEMIEPTARQARRFAAGLREAGHEILNNWSTTDEDVERSIEAMVRCAGSGGGL